MRALVWFRSDLRINDNPALSHASRDATKGVIAVFVASPTQWRDEHDLSDAKADLILRTLSVLSADLKRLNIPLKIVRADPFDRVPDALQALAREHEIDSLYFNDEYELNERNRDEAVRSTFEDAGLVVHTFRDQIGMDTASIRTQQGGFYSVFTPFKKSWIAAHQDGKAREIAPKPKKQPALAIKPDPIPNQLHGFAPTEHLHNLWPAGEHHAAKLLSEFCAGPIHSYKDDRDTPSLDATSSLSPYLACGSISSMQCITAATEANDGKLDSGSASAAHWISEVVWREFYRHILVGFPRVCRHQPFKPETDRIKWVDNDDHFKAWCEGRTGVPIVDAAMRQLLATGWMHNRLRMVAAMYLTKDLFLDWRKGERFFSRHLIDCDLANNNGGWQWSASTGVDAAPYFRIFNPYSQSKKCDPDGTFIGRYVPELADLEGPNLHDPSKLPGLLRSQLEYPEPLVDHKAARERAIQAFKAIR